MANRLARNYVVDPINGAYGDEEDRLAQAIVDAGGISGGGGGGTGLSKADLSDELIPLETDFDSLSVLQQDILTAQADIVTAISDLNTDLSARNPGTQTLNAVYDLTLTPNVANSIYLAFNGPYWITGLSFTLSAGCLIELSKDGGFVFFRAQNASAVDKTYTFPLPGTTSISATAKETSVPVRIVGSMEYRQ